MVAGGAEEALRPPSMDQRVSALLYVDGERLKLRERILRTLAAMLWAILETSSMSKLFAYIAHVWIAICLKQVAHCRR